MTMKTTQTEEIARRDYLMMSTSITIPTIHAEHWAIASTPVATKSYGRATHDMHAVNHGDAFADRALTSLLA